VGDLNAKRYSLLVQHILAGHFNGNSQQRRTIGGLTAVKLIICLVRKLLATTFTLLPPAWLLSPARGG
jgi:hypothetical protein